VIVPETKAVIRKKSYRLQTFEPREHLHHFIKCQDKVSSNFCGKSTFLRISADVEWWHNKLWLSIQRAKISFFQDSFTNGGRSLGLLLTRGESSREKNLENVFGPQVAHLEQNDPWIQFPI